MPVVRVDLSTESYERLAHLAVRERRPIPMQAEYLIERAIRRAGVAPRPVTTDFDPPAGADPGKGVRDAVAA